MSWKSLLFDESEHKPDAAPQPTPQPKLAVGITGIPGFTPAPATTVPIFAATPLIPIIGTADASMSNQFVQMLREKFASSGQFSVASSGQFSVVSQFQAILKSLEEAIPEEGSRFRAAIKVLASQSGLDATKLAEAYQSIITVLDAEAMKFASTIQGKMVNEVSAREQQVTQVNQQIEVKNAEIKSLMDQRDQFVIAITEQKTKLAAAQASFDGAQTTLHGEINDTLNKLKIYVPVSAASK